MLQQIFEKSIKGVLEQGTTATNDNGSCVYSAPNGNRCAVGVLLTPEEAKRWNTYNHGEAWSIDVIVDTNEEGFLTQAELEEAITDLSNHGIDISKAEVAYLLQELQHVHDSSSDDVTLDFFKQRAIDLGKRFRLNTDFIKDY